MAPSRSEVSKIEIDVALAAACGLRRCHQLAHRRQDRKRHRVVPRGLEDHVHVLGRRVDVRRRVVEITRLQDRGFQRELLRSERPGLQDIHHRPQIEPALLTEGQRLADHRGIDAHDQRMDELQIGSGVARTDMERLGGHRLERGTAGLEVGGIAGREERQPAFGSKPDAARHRSAEIAAPPGRGAHRRRRRWGDGGKVGIDRALAQVRDHAVGAERDLVQDPVVHDHRDDDIARLRDRRRA